MKVKLDFIWKHDGKHHFGTINEILYKHGSSIVCRYYTDFMVGNDGVLMFNPLILFKRGKCYFLTPESFNGDIDYADFESVGCNSHAYERIESYIEDQVA